MTMMAGGREDSLTPTMKSLRLELSSAIAGQQKGLHGGTGAISANREGSRTERGTPSNTLRDKKFGILSMRGMTGSLTQRDTLYMKPPATTPRIDK